MISQPLEIFTPESFETSIQAFTFQQKYFKWDSYIKLLKQSNSEYLQAALQKAVEFYPFNHSFWSDLLDIVLKMPKGKSNTLKMQQQGKHRYQVALAKNPRCITLWRKYLDWLVKQLQKSDPAYLKNQIENATRIIGNHYKASFVFEYYLSVEKNAEKQYNMLKKAIVSPLEDIDKIRDIYLALIDSPEFQPVTFMIAESEGLTLQQNNQNREEVLRILQEQLKRRINKLYEPTRQHVSDRQVFQSKILKDEYVPYSDSIENWRKYIAFIKNSGNSQFLPTIYERALINHCDNQALWEEYFLLLENEGNHQRALYLFRYHSIFFKNMSKQLIYYWLEIEQRDNPAHARQLYLQLQKTTNNLQIFIRHIQMQLRAKQFPNAKAIYQAILTVFASNLQIVVQIVIEYAEFSVRYFRQIGFAKKLLQNYFTSYPFDECLFIYLLEFYEKNIEFKENTKQSKQIADEYIEYMLLGLRKAQQCFDKNQYKRIKKIAGHHLRAYIISIYLIKGAERKIKEQQIQIEKESEAINGKRIMRVGEALEISGRKMVSR